MTTLNNEISINAPIGKIFQALAEMEGLEKLDPNVKKSTSLSDIKTGMSAKRKVDMMDGKNWFEEKVIGYKLNESLTYELTACSFPVKSLKYIYTVEKSGNQTKVQQAMTYEIKFGLFGKILDSLMIRKRYNKGIQGFFIGLKSFAEKNTTGH
jgi:ribosome-associated toxin RatA of RatAB toxin-antitoxin module